MTIQSAWNGALSKLEELLLRHANPRGIVAAGYTYIKKGRYDVAADTFADAERLMRERGMSPHRIAEAMAFRAWCYAKLNRSGEAVSLYEDALKLEQQADATPERIAQLREQLDWAKTKLSAG